MFLKILLLLILLLLVDFFAHLQFLSRVGNNDLNIYAAIVTFLVMVLEYYLMSNSRPVVQLARNP